MMKETADSRRSSESTSMARSRSTIHSTITIFLALTSLLGTATSAFTFPSKARFSNNNNNNQQKQQQNHDHFSRSRSNPLVSTRLFDSNNKNPFQFEPSPELARALGVADPEHPMPPKTPPPPSSFEATELTRMEHAADTVDSDVPFFLLDRDLAVNVMEAAMETATQQQEQMQKQKEEDESVVDVTATRDDDVPFSSWTVVQLKAELRRRGLPVSGKKAILVERLEQSLQSQIAQAVVASSTSLATTSSQAAWHDVIDPWLQARLQKGVDLESIQGALVAGTALTAVASKSVAVSSVVGLLAAYTAITQGSVGQWTRQVGKVVWDAVVAATEVAKQVDESGAPVQFLGQSLSLVGTLVNKTIASVESGMVAASQAQEMELAAAAAADLRQQQDEEALEKRAALAKQQSAFLQQLMAQRFVYDAITAKQRKADAFLKTQQRQTAFLQQLMTVRFEVQAKEQAAQLEELARQQEAARVAEENERLRLAQLLMERAQMEEQAKAVAAEEAARLVAEAAPAMVQQEILEERARMAEANVLAAAEEAARVVANAVSDTAVDDENEISEEDWMASIRVAQKSIEGKMAGFDDDDKDLFVDQQERETWEKAEQLAKQLGQESVENGEADGDELDLENIDFDAVGKAARAAVDDFEMMRNPQQQSVEENDQTDESSTWSSLTMAELRSECKSRGLLTTGKKVDLISRLDSNVESNNDARSDDDFSSDDVAHLERPIAEDAVEAVDDDADDDLDDFDLDSIDLSTVGDLARAAVEEFERMRSPVSAEMVESDAKMLTDLASLSFSQLRTECKTRGLSTTGKKPELIARLENFAGTTVLADMDEDLDIDLLLEGDDLDDIDLDEIDISAVGDAARAAVEEFERMRAVNGGSSEPLPILEQDWNTLTLSQLRTECTERGLGIDGKKADLVARLEDYESVSLLSDDEDLLEDSEDSLDLSLESDDVMDWNTLTIKELQQELQDRNLPTTGKKADLVAALEAYTSSDNYVDESALDSDLEELALRYGSKARSDDDDDSDDDLDLDIDFDSLDLDAMGQAARQAVDMFSMEQVDEPTDEDLWEIEAMTSLPEADDFDVSSLDLDIGVSLGIGGELPIVYAKMTVNELKEELRLRGLSVTGKKTELIERLFASDSSDVPR